MVFVRFESGPGSGGSGGGNGGFVIENGGFWFVLYCGIAAGRRWF